MSRKDKQLGRVSKEQQVINSKVIVSSDFRSQNSFDLKLSAKSTYPRKLRFSSYNQEFTQRDNGSCLRLLRSQDKMSKQKTNRCKTLHESHDYNKWYIKPQVRLLNPFEKYPFHRRSQLKNKKNQLYQNLYNEYIIDEENPFKLQKNKNFQNLQRISPDNIMILSDFKRKLEESKIRVPKIVNLFIERRRESNIS